MNATAPDETIFALSSGAPPAAIAVVRVSGPAARDVLLLLAGRLPPPRRATYAALIAIDRTPLDHGLILWFPGPATATGEDLAELHLHGGCAVVAAVLDALALMPGCRPAAPGEFTRRAFANGRIDLAEAEGLADLLAAETEGQRRQALRMAEGGLGRLTEGWRTRLLHLSAGVEAALEFGDEEIDVPAIAAVQHEELATLAVEIAQSLDEPPAERLHEGVRVVLAGPTNSGKSSLLNTLVGREAAIATDIAGTTRDLIEVPIRRAGLAFILVDTAGLRKTDDPVERIGVARSQEALERADLILWLGVQDAMPADDRVILVSPRADLDPVSSRCAIATSTVTGQGIADLWEAITTRARQLLPGETHLALNQRQRAALRDVLQAVSASWSDDMVLLGENLRLARAALDRVIGRAGVEDMLDTLFGRFCIGK